MKITIRKIGDVAVPATDADREKWEKYSDAEYVVDMRNLDQRTVQQNKALHKWCQQIADTLNAEGLYMTGIFGNPIEWTMELVKTQIVKATVKKVFWHRQHHEAQTQGDRPADRLRDRGAGKQGRDRAAVPES